VKEIKKTMTNQMLLNIAYVMYEVHVNYIVF
jgi:hypothetical protein